MGPSRLAPPRSQADHIRAVPSLGRHGTACGTNQGRPAMTWQTVGAKSEAMSHVGAPDAADRLSSFLLPSRALSVRHVRSSADEDVAGRGRVLEACWSHGQGLWLRLTSVSGVSPCLVQRSRIEREGLRLPWCAWCRDLCARCRQPRSCPVRRVEHPLGRVPGAALR